jgi:hypothetical protein
MFSRRGFLIGLFLLAQMGLANKVSARVSAKTNRKFLKQGWLLQEGDV